MLRSVFVACAIFCGNVAHAQTAERIAALRFVEANGFDIPQRVYVARETISDSTRPGPPAKTGAALRQQAAIEIVQSLGRGAEAGSVEDLLECRKTICVARSDVPLVVVADPAVSGGETVVRVELYSSASSNGVIIRMLTVAQVVIARKGSGWEGVRYGIRPVRTEPRLPPPDDDQDQGFICSSGGAGAQ